MRKWLILLSYFMASFANGLAWATLIPIPDKAMSYYHINSAELTLYALLFEILSLPLAPLSTWIISKSFFASLHIVWALTLVGGWIRVAAFRNFWISLVGQIFIASNNMLILCSCSNMASIWFPASQAVLATSIAAAANFAGMSLAFIFMPYYEDIELMMWIQAGIITFFFILNVFSVKKDRKTEKAIGFKEGFIMGLKDKYLLVMALCAGSGLGVNYAIIGILGLLLEDFGYSDIDIGWVGFVFLFSGLFGGLIATYLTEVKKSTQIPLQYFLIFSSIIGLGFAAIVRFDYYSFFPAALYGTALTGFLPLSIRVCVEYMDNVDESIPTNMIYFFGQVFGTVYTYPIQYSKEFIGISGLWIAGILIVISFTIYYFVVRKSNNSSTKKLNNFSMQKVMDSANEKMITQ